MGRPKSMARLRRLVAEQQECVLQITTRLVEAEESLAELSADDPRYGLAGRLAGARRGQVENATSKLERVTGELEYEVRRRRARTLLLGGANDTENIT